MDVVELFVGNGAVFLETRRGDEELSCEDVFAYVLFPFKGGTLTERGAGWDPVNVS